MLSYQTFATFLSLFYLHTLCYFINFCRLIKLSSPYQTFVMVSSFVIYSPFTLSTNPINAPAVQTTNTTLSPVLSRARSLRQYTFLTHQASLAIVPFWFGGGGGFYRDHQICYKSPRVKFYPFSGTPWKI